jgi:hypothetical protein
MDDLDLDDPDERRGTAVEQLAEASIERRSSNAIGHSAARRPAPP